MANLATLWIWIRDVYMCVRCSVISFQCDDVNILQIDRMFSLEEYIVQVFEPGASDHFFFSYAYNGLETGLMYVYKSQK